MITKHEIRKHLAALTMVAVLLMLPGPEEPRGDMPGNGARATPVFAPGEVLVEMVPGLTPAAMGFPSLVPVSEVRTIPSYGRPSSLFLVRLQQGQSVEDAVAAFRRDPAVKMAGPNYYNYPFAQTTDYDPVRLWHLEKVAAPNAWDIATGSGVLVGVIDTGVDYTHPDLLGNMWASDSNGEDFTDASGDAYPVSYDHGTHVAGIIGARGNNPGDFTAPENGVVGMAYNAQILALKSFHDIGTGATDADTIAAINFAAANGVSVVNMSLGRTGPVPVGMETAMGNAIAGGVLFVIAAGNGGDDGIGDNNDILSVWPANFANATLYPATAPGVISVAATDSSDALASFSNFGASSVTLASPGKAIKSTITGRQTVYEETGPGAVSGATSLCSAGVAGCFDGTLFDQGATDCVINTGATCEWGWSQFSSWYILGDADATAGGTYNLDTSATIVSQALDLSSYTKPILRYKSVWNLECLDYVDVEARPNVGAGWTVLSPDNGFNVDQFGASCGQPHTHAGRATFIMGTSVTPIAHDLSGQFGAATQIRFTFTSNSSTNDTNLIGAFQLTGLKIDAQATGYDSAFGSKSGTSMAAPVVAGIAALIKESNPAFTPAEIKTRIVSTGDVLCGLKGRLVYAKRVNAEKALLNITTSDACTSKSPAAVGTGGGGDDCLFTWISEDYLSRGALDPLRRFRDALARQGGWGRTLVRSYYRFSAIAIRFLESLASLWAP